MPEDQELLWKITQNKPRSTLKPYSRNTLS